jgi:hypothetical protein
MPCHSFGDDLRDHMDETDGPEVRDGLGPSFFGTTLLGKGLALRWVLVAQQEGSAPLLLRSGAPESGGPLLQI